MRSREKQVGEDLHSVCSPPGAGVACVVVSPENTRVLRSACPRE